jgi:Flp pilus assembly CpaF family ATPase
VSLSASTHSRRDAENPFESRVDLAGRFATSERETQAIRKTKTDRVTI